LITYLTISCVDSTENKYLKSRQINTIIAYESFIKENYESQYVDSARIQIIKIEELQERIREKKRIEVEKTKYQEKIKEKVRINNEINKIKRELKSRINYDKNDICKDSYRIHFYDKYFTYKNTSVCDDNLSVNTVKLYYKDVKSIGHGAGNNIQHYIDVRGNVKSEHATNDGSIYRHNDSYFSIIQENTNNINYIIKKLKKLLSLINKRKVIVDNPKPLYRDRNLDDNNCTNFTYYGSILKEDNDYIEYYIKCNNDKWVTIAYRKNNNGYGGYYTNTNNSSQTESAKKACGCD
jgi:hypothetical protein